MTAAAACLRRHDKPQRLRDALEERRMARQSAGGVCAAGRAASEPACVETWFRVLSQVAGRILGGRLFEHAVRLLRGRVARSQRCSFHRHILRMCRASGGPKGGPCDLIEGPVTAVSSRRAGGRRSACLCAVRYLVSRVTCSNGLYAAQGYDVVSSLTRL